MASTGNAVSMTFKSNIDLSQLTLNTWIFDNSDLSYTDVGWFRKNHWSIRLANDVDGIKNKYRTSNVQTEEMLEEGDEKHVLSILQDLVKDLEFAGCYECSITKQFSSSPTDN